MERRRKKVKEGKKRIKEWRKMTENRESITLIIKREFRVLENLREGGRGGDNRREEG